MKHALRIIALLLSALMLAAIPPIEGSSSGIHSQASSGCTCHQTTIAPSISENFPATYNGGQTYNIQISVSGYAGSNGGFNVMVDKGTLSAPGVGIMAVKVNSAGTSVTHTTNSYRSWSFDWTAPSSGSGAVTVDIAAVAANGANGNSGDAKDQMQLTIPEPGPTNTAPTATNVFISDGPAPAPAITQAYYDVDLFANYDFTDPDGDPDTSSQIRWMNSGVTATQHNDQPILPQASTAIGDLWTMSVTPNDGTDLGSTVTSSNTVEIIDYDADSDGYGDQSDAFPNDPNEWLDTDGDGVGDNTDDFDDDATQTTDTDGDGYGDNASGNNPDAFPNDEEEWSDNDNDGTGDNADAFDNDATQTTDTDGDGYGDNAAGNNPDAFPNDASEWADTDGDGVGNNADAFDNDATQTEDGDGDGYGDNAAGNNADAFPNDSTEWAR